MLLTFQAGVLIELPDQTTPNILYRYFPPNPVNSNRAVYLPYFEQNHHLPIEIKLFAGIVYLLTITLNIKPVNNSNPHNYLQPSPVNS